MMDQEKNQTNDQDLSEQQELRNVEEPEVISSSSSERMSETPPQQIEINPRQESEPVEKLKELMEQAGNRQANRPKNPHLIVQRCLKKSFKDHNAIRDFCYYHFEEVFKELRETDGYADIIRYLIIYCETSGEMEELWSCIKEKWIKQYNTYYPEWKRAVVEYQKWQESREDIQAIHLLAQLNDRFGSGVREKPLDINEKNQAHPLTGDDRAAISDWFYKELKPQEQSMVLTVALFEGINRKHMIPISQEIERRLFETSRINLVESNQ